MYFIAPGIRVFMRDRLKVLSITLLQIFLICSSPLMFAQVPDIVPAPDGGAGGDSGNDIVDCIFKDGFEACLAYIEGFPDTDGDGFGDSTSESTSFCNNIWPGFVDNNRDCNDSSDAMFPGNAESCDGVDNDCDPASADGSEDPLIAQTCDGPDSDLCVEGTYSCVSGALACSDNSSSTTDVCDGVDNDCDPASADGSEDPLMAQSCDGPDSDLCVEGTYSCVSGALACSDNSSSTTDVCDGVDNDCDPASADGSEDPLMAQTCDGPDSDLCVEGTYSCVSGALACSDNSSSTTDVCDGVDNDCDPASADGSEDPLMAQTCDGPDSDLCVEGTYFCVNGALACSDNSSSTTDVCDGVDNDCDPASADGSEDPDVGMACTTGQPGVCSEGTINCTDGALMCVADVQPGPEVCDGLDNDCDGDIDEGCGDLVVMGSDRSNRLKTLEYYVN